MSKRSNYLNPDTLRSVKQRSRIFNDDKTEYIQRFFQLPPELIQKIFKINADRDEKIANSLRILINEDNYSRRMSQEIRNLVKITDIQKLESKLPLLMNIMNKEMATFLFKPFVNTIKEQFNTTEQKELMEIMRIIILTCNYVHYRRICAKLRREFRETRSYLHLMGDQGIIIDRQIINGFKQACKIYGMITHGPKDTSTGITKYYQALDRDLVLKDKYKILLDKYVKVTFVRKFILNFGLLPSPLNFSINKR